MSTTAQPSRNGVDTATLFATLDAVRGENEMVKPVLSAAVAHA